MKNLYFAFIFFVFCGLSVFGGNVTRKEAETVIAEPAAPEIVLEVAPAVAPDTAPGKAISKIPWWILPIMAIYIILFFLIKKRPRKQARRTETATGKVLVSGMDFEPNFIPTAAVTTCTVNLDDEIRSRACELSQQRHAGRSDACLNDNDGVDSMEDYLEQDWYDAVQEISALYTARGHSVYSDDGYWWASRSYSW